MTTPIYVSDIFASEQIISLCQAATGHIVIVTDENVGKYYATSLFNHFAAHAIKVNIITIPAGENSKSRKTKHAIEDKMFTLGCNRDTLMIALGGGVVTDLTGFVAATFCRGIPVIYIPTSLLAMVDAANGGKTGINTDYGKNLIGTFTDPQAIFIDINCLDTLPHHEYITAFSEIIKHALITDAAYFELIESSIHHILEKNKPILNQLIQRSCEIKSAIVLEDQTEQSRREILNFGHTIAHALEISSQYLMNHGQAVAIGMIVECYLSNQMGLLPDTDLHRMQQLILNLHIPLTFNRNFSKPDIINAFHMDKKNRHNKNRFVLLSKIGEVLHRDNTYAHPVDSLLLNQEIDYFFQLCTD